MRRRSTRQVRATQVPQLAEHTSGPWEPRPFLVVDVRARGDLAAEAS
jgi:hypothetical protein